MKKAAVLQQNNKKRSLNVFKILWVMYKDIVRFFSGLTFLNKVLLTSFSSVVVVAGLSLYFGVRAYKQDKISYIFETHALHTNIAAKSIQNVLTSEKEQLNISEVDSELVPEKLNISRFPEKQETFLGIDTNKDPNSPEKYLLIWRSLDGKLISSPISMEVIKDALKEHSAQTMFVLTQYGEIVFAYFAEAEAKGNIKDIRPSFKFMLKSNLMEGNSLIKINNKDVAVGYREVPSTNLLIVTETSLMRIMYPFYKALFLWGMGVVGVFVVGMFFQGLILRKLGQPINRVLDLFNSIIRGSFVKNIKVEDNEFAPIFNGIKILQNVIFDREQRLKIFSKGLETALTISQSPDMLDKPHLACNKFLEEFLNFLPISQNVPCYVFVKEQKGESGTSSWLNCSLLTAMVPERNEDEIKWTPANNLQEQFEIFVFEHGKNLKTLNQINDFELISSLYGGYSKESSTIFALPMIHKKEIVGIFLCGMNFVPEFPEFNELVQILRSTFEDLLNQRKASNLAEHEASISSELETARKLQQASVSNIQITIPEIAASTLFEPAEQVGGDWMGLFVHENLGLLHFFMGDVTGHGISSAFMTTVISGAVNSFESSLDNGFTFLDMEILDRDRYLIDLAQRLNYLICSSKVAEKWMTMILGSLDYKTGKLSYINAGHQPLLHIQAANNKTKPVRNVQSTMLGYGNDSEFNLCNLQLEHGDLICLYTDGLIENATQKNLPLKPKHVKDFLTKQMPNLHNPEKLTSLAKDTFDMTFKIAQKYEKLDDVAIMAIQWK